MASPSLHIMPLPAPTYATLEEWIARESIPFALDSPDVFNAAIDKVVGALGDTVNLLGFGEALHGGKEIHFLRNRLFRRLVEAHGYSAIAIESSFPRARVVNEYVLGRGADTLETVMNTGVSHGFGSEAANRELVEWMRSYNSDPSHSVKLHFYGFDSPTEMTGTDSPRQLLIFALDYLASIKSDGCEERRQRIDALLGVDSAWENPAAMMDASQSIGLSPEANALRIETENLITELGMLRPKFPESAGKDRWLEAAHYASAARQLLTYHAALANPASRRLVEGLGIRDLMMGDNLAYMVRRESARAPDGGRVFAFAHNSHLQRGLARWQLGPHSLEWYPAGSHVHEIFGSRYAVIGSAIGVSDVNGIGQPEAGTLEARLAAAPGPLCFIPTHTGEGLPAADIAALTTRSASSKNSTYFPLTAQSITDFDWLVVLG